MTLAPCSKLWPHRLDRGFEVEQATLNTHQHRNRADALRAGSNDTERVIAPWHAIRFYATP